jgi:tetrahydromethanopterin S-methyltransferase subunit D
VASFDGAGNVALSLTFVGLSGASGQPALFTGTQTGTYSINSDGSGTINLVPASGNGNGQSFVFVIIDGGSGALLLQTSRLGDGVQFGTARLQ